MDGVFKNGHFFMVYGVGRASACGGFDTIKEARDAAMDMPNAEFIYKIKDNERCTIVRKYKMSKAWEKRHKLEQK